MYYPNYPFGRRKSFSGARVIVICVLGFTFLLISALEYWLALPAWQLRLQGVQTTATAHIIGDCSDDDGSASYYFSFTFTDLRGESHRIAHDSFCTNVINDGDQVNVWYLPGNPENMMTDVESYLLYGFSGVGLLIAVVDFIIVLVMIFRFLLANRSGSSLDYTASRYRQGF